MSVLTYYPYIKLGLAWMGLTGKCIRAKSAAGETIDVWDWLDCAVGALSSIEADLMPLLADQAQKNVRTRL
jgi:hypothetical protein